MYQHEYEKITGCRIAMPSFNVMQGTPTPEEDTVQNLKEETPPVTSYDTAIKRLLMCQTYFRALLKLEGMITDEITKVAAYADKTGNKDLSFYCATLYGRKEFYRLCVANGFKARSEDYNEPYNTRY